MLGALVCVGMLASCAVQPPAKSTAATPAVMPSAASSSTPSPSSEPPVAAAPAPVVVTPATIQTAQRQATAAIELLEAGNEEQASAELQRAVQNDPNNKLAQSLLRQIQVDPVATLGREHFIYRVQAGESISRIAQRFLGDVHQFYILARYNDLKVPKQLQSGQMIKVPGKAPPASTANAVPVGPKPSPAANATPASAVTPVPVQPSAVSTAPTTDPAKLGEQERAAKVTASTKAARAAYARQDLVSAIRHWDSVLDLDPVNSNAKIERQRAVDLKAKLDKLK